MYLQPAPIDDHGDDPHSPDSPESQQDYNYIDIIDETQSNHYENIPTKNNDNHQYMDPSENGTGVGGTNTNVAHYETLRVEKSNIPPTACIKCNKTKLIMLIALISAIIIAGLLGVIIFLLSSDRDIPGTTTDTTDTLDTSPRSLVVTTDTRTYPDMTEGIVKL